MEDLCFVLHFTNLFISCPSLIFLEGMKNLATHLKMSYFFLSFTHTWLLYIVGSQSREGDSDLLSAQAYNNKITSLPACSGHENSCNLILLPGRETNHLCPKIKTIQLTNSRQVSLRTLLLEHSRWPPRGCAHESGPSCGGEELLPEPWDGVEVEEE